MCLHRWLRNMSYGTNDNGKERYNLMRKTLIIIIGVIIIMLTTICNIGLLEKEKYNSITYCRRFYR